MDDLSVHAVCPTCGSKPQEKSDLAARTPRFESQMARTWAVPNHQPSKAKAHRWDRSQSMRERNRIFRTLVIDNLVAHLVVNELERIGLTLEIDSPQTPAERKAEAAARQNIVLAERREVLSRLEELQNLDSTAGY